MNSRESASPAFASRCAISSSPLDLVDVRDDVLHRQRRGVADALDQIPSQPTRVLHRIRGQDDFVGPVLCDRVHRRHERVGVADLAAGLDAFRRYRRKRQIDAHLGGFADGLVVDDKAR
jgi:hypothetical protein